MELISEFREIVGHEGNMKKSTAFLYKSNEQLKCN
jgi:hypothetical protein